MTPAALLADLTARGVNLSADSDGLHYDGPPGSVSADDLDAIRAHKAELLAHLAAEARRQAVLKMLDDAPGIRYAFTADDPDTDPVLAALAIRDVGTCELAIPQARYDGFALLSLIEQHAGAQPQALSDALP